MDECIQTGVTTNATTLPGRLGLRRRAPILYRRLMRGFYPGVMSPPSNNARIEADSNPSETFGGSIDAPKSRGEKFYQTKQGSSFETMGARIVDPAIPSAKRAPRVIGAFDHPLLPEPPVRGPIVKMSIN